MICIKEKCSGCGVCQNVCMFGAIEFVDTKLVFTDKCVNCGACAKKCPCDAIIIENEEKKNINLDEYKNIWVIAEVDQKSNQLRKISLELLSKARELADIKREKVCAVLLCEEYNGCYDSVLKKVGCDELIVVKDSTYKMYNTIPFCNGIVELVKKLKPASVLFPGTENGRDLAPRVASLMQTGLTADCTGLELDEDCNLVQIRPTFGGNIMASILTPEHRPQMASVRPNVFTVQNVADEHSLEIKEIEPTWNVSEGMLYPFKIEEKKTVYKDVAEADVLIVAGYGVGSYENYKKVEKLAIKMNAAIGVTRKVVDEGWAPAELQVGQTGKTVAPDLYIGFGVSGALQHSIGIKNSKYIIAVNNDPVAPIFQMADKAILGDCVEVAEKMIENLEKK